MSFGGTPIYVFFISYLMVACFLILCCLARVSESNLGLIWLRALLPVCHKDSTDCCEVPNSNLLSSELCSELLGRLRSRFSE